MSFLFLCIHIYYCINNIILIDIEVLYKINQIKLNVDYSGDSSVSWSEFKINNNLAAPIDFNGYNILTYDFIYNPSKMTQGGFQSKLFINGAVDSYDVINLDN